jgi:hypothetical protein
VNTAIINPQFVEPNESVADRRSDVTFPRLLSVYTGSERKRSTHSAGLATAPIGTRMETTGVPGNSDLNMGPAFTTLVRADHIGIDLETARRELMKFERSEAQEIAHRNVGTVRSAGEAWKKFKPLMDQFLGLFPNIQSLELEWRRDVFCGREQFDEKMDQATRSLYGLWFSYSLMFKEKAEFLGRHLPGIPDESLDTIVRNTRTVDRLLRAWEPPVLSRGYSFRAPPLSPEAAARFKEIFPETI